MKKHTITEFEKMLVELTKSKEIKEWKGGVLKKARKNYNKKTTCNIVNCENPDEIIVNNFFVGGFFAPKMKITKSKKIKGEEITTNLPYPVKKEDEIIKIIPLDKTT